MRYFENFIKIITPGILSNTQTTHPNVDLPTCQPHEASHKLFNWAACPLDPNAHYGVSKTEYSLVSAETQCESVGAKLIEITDEHIDICAYYAISKFIVPKEFVLFSGHYFPYFEQWAWCPNYHTSPEIESACSANFNYHNPTFNQQSPTGYCIRVVEWSQNLTGLKLKRRLFYILSTKVQPVFQV